MKFAAHFFTPIHSEEPCKNKEGGLIFHVVVVEIPPEKSFNYP
jgi:hypothetical protein